MTKDYLIGTWTTTTGAETETFMFYPDGSFYLYYFSNMGQSSYSSGTFAVSGSQLIMNANNNEQSFTITFIDQNTFQMQGYTYKRK
jgi:hypothetical protein